MSGVQVVLGARLPGPRQGVLCSRCEGTGFGPGAEWLVSSVVALADWPRSSWCFHTVALVALSRL